MKNMGPPKYKLINKVLVLRRCLFQEVQRLEAEPMAGVLGCFTDEEQILADGERVKPQVMREVVVESGAGDEPSWRHASWLPNTPSEAIKARALAKMEGSFRYRSVVTEGSPKQIRNR